MKVRVRISDNVLKESGWSARELEFVEGKVVAIRQVTDGAYTFWGGPDVGWTLEQLVEWTRYDGSGRHVENYHEVLIDKEWKSFATLDDFERRVEFVDADGKVTNVFTPGEPLEVTGPPPTWESMDIKLGETMTVLTVKKPKGEDT